MPKQDVDTTIDSRLLASTKLVRFEGKTILDMNGDDRLERLVSEVRSEIVRNKWDPKHNEKEIAEKTVSLMSSDRFYGKYDPETMKSNADLDVLRNKLIKSVTSGGPMLNPNELHEVQTLVVENDRRGGVNLKDYPKNHLVCREEAAVTSYVLQKVGVENHMCLTPGYNQDGHAFVQSKATGNIIEATNPNNSYRINLSGTQIADGKIVLTRGENSEIHFYGDGKTRFKGNEFTNLIGYTKQVKADYALNRQEAMGDYERKLSHQPQQHFDPTQPISMQQAQENIVRHYAQFDRGKHILGFIPAGGKFDGYESPQELIEHVERSGHKLSPERKKEITAKPGFDLSALIMSNIANAREADKNHDGKITPKELDEQIKHIEERMKKEGSSIPPTALKNISQSLRDHVYGR